ncbi:hypothetical protein L6R52_42055 [Myxococcota bacterium]|nr:hypothetical protein [Myxococcota bacterium]
MSLSLRLAGATFGLAALMASESVATLAHRGRRSEARANLGAIATAMESFLADEGFLPAIEVQPPVVQVPDPTGRRLWGTPRCDAACGKAAPWACRYFDCLGWRPSRDPRYFYACTSLSRSGVSDFTCAAVGDLDEDGVPAVYVFGSDHGGTGSIVAPVPSIAPTSGCALGRTPAGQVVECTPGVW